VNATILVVFRPCYNVNVNVKCEFIQRILGTKVSKSQTITEAIHCRFEAAACVIRATVLSVIDIPKFYVLSFGLSFSWPAFSYPSWSFSAPPPQALSQYLRITWPIHRFHDFHDFCVKLRSASTVCTELTSTAVSLLLGHHV